MEPNSKTEDDKKANKIELEEKENKPEEITFKEKRIREITLMYYSRQDIKKALFEFSQNRETIPRYFEGFGKRPDAFQYDSDIIEQVKKGATSFHSSEELWQDPLEISTNFSKKELDELRIGWDLLLDIDSPYLEYSKIYADLLIKTLKFHGIMDMGVKFSGSKGFHIIIPWKAFPEEIYGIKTKTMFPEWPRLICEYLADIIKPKLEEEILRDNNLSQIALKTGKEEKDLMIKKCASCGRPAIKKDLVKWLCPNCKNELVMIKKNKRIPKCPSESCRKLMIEASSKEVYACDYCNINSYKNPEMFKEKERFATEKLIDADLILVAPRHLFRMPYSLHEKTALASIVINSENIRDFQIKDAMPLRVKIKPYYLTPKKEEAKDLLLQALDWKEQKDKQERTIKNRKSEINESNPSIKHEGDYKQITIPNPTEDIFPPQIKLLLKGVKQDGRKRALFILLSFFKFLGVSESEIEKRINEWNEKNYNPLKKGYIQSQISWYMKNPPRLPPNFDNSIYKDLGVDVPDELAKQTKNPVSYAIKKYFMNRK